MFNSEFIKRARVGNRDRIAIDHCEAFLINGVLTFRFSDFFFSWISNQLFNELFIRDKAWPDFMIMLSFLSLVAQLFSDIEIRELGWLHKIGIHFKSKGSEASIINTSPCGHVLSNVFCKPSEDKVELRFGIQRFNGFTSPWLGHKMAARVILRV